MTMLVYIAGECVGAVSGCDAIGEAWVQAQRLAEMLDASCALVSAETGEVLVLWKP